VRREERHYCRTPVVVKRLLLERHFNVICSNLFLFLFRLKLLIQLVIIVQVINRNLLVSFFLRKNSIHYRPLNSGLDFDIAFRVYVVALNVKTRIYFDWSFGLLLLVLCY